MAMQQVYERLVSLDERKAPICFTCQATILGVKGVKAGTEACGFNNREKPQETSTWMPPGKAELTLPTHSGEPARGEGDEVNSYPRTQPALPRRIQGSLVLIKEGVEASSRVAE